MNAPAHPVYSISAAVPRSPGMRLPSPFHTLSFLVTGPACAHHGHDGGPPGHPERPSRDRQGQRDPDRGLPLRPRSGRGVDRKEHRRHRGRLLRVDPAHGRGGRRRKAAHARGGGRAHCHQRTMCEYASSPAFPHAAGRPVPPTRASASPAVLACDPSARERGTGKVDQPLLEAISGSRPRSAGGIFPAVSNRHAETLERDMPTSLFSRPGSKSRALAGGDGEEEDGEFEEA